MAPSELTAPTRAASVASVLEVEAAPALPAMDAPFDWLPMLQTVQSTLIGEVGTVEGEVGTLERVVSERDSEIAALRARLAEMSQVVSTGTEDTAEELGRLKALLAAAQADLTVERKSLSAEMGSLEPLAMEYVHWAGCVSTTLTSELSSTEAEFNGLERRIEAAEDAARAAARETSRMQSLLDEVVPELDEWRRRFNTRVDASTISESVMASAIRTEALISPLGDELAVDEDNLLPEPILSKLVSEIYKEKAALDKVMEGGEPTGKSLTEFVEQKYLRRYGLKKISDENMHFLVASIRLWKLPNRKIRTFGRFCGMYNVLDNDCLLFYLTFVGVTREQHGRDFAAEWLGSDKQSFSVTAEVALRAIRVVFDFLSSERMQQVSHRVTQLLQTVQSKKGAEQLVDFDDLSDVVIDEHKTETARNIRYLEAVFNAADVDGDGVLTFDEFAEMVRRVEPNVSPQRTSALFAECLKESGGDGIRPSAFADCAIKNGLVKTKTSGKPTAKLSAKESLKALKELWAGLAPQLEHLDESERTQLKPIVNEVSALLGEKKPNDDKAERAWLLYQNVVAEIAHCGAKRRKGERTSHGGIVLEEEIRIKTEPAQALETTVEQPAEAAAA